ncbi:MAG: hypothetical protein Q9217_004157 [Psora testacea]
MNKPHATLSEISVSKILARDAFYKPPRKHSGVVSDTRDGSENFLVPLNVLLQLESVGHDWPESMKSRLPLLRNFELACYKIAQEIIRALPDGVLVQPEIPFQDLHRERQTSTTSLAMLMYLLSTELSEDRIGHMAQTDVGTLTLLFTSSPGLEVFYHNDAWISVFPRSGRVLVNVGDALSFASGLQLKSCLHRVVPPSNPAGFSENRFSLAFFLRPELSARFVDGQGKEWTGVEWHRTKYEIFRANDEEQDTFDLGLDVYPNGDRRKRRRTVPPDHEPHNLYTDEPQSWADQLQAAARDFHDVSEDYSNALDLVSMSTYRTTTRDKANDAASTTKDDLVEIGHPPPSSDSRLQNAQASMELMPQHEPAPTLPKKMLKVQADGTLSSPTKLAPANGARPKRARTNLDKALSGGNLVVIIKYGKLKRSRILLGQKIDKILSTPSMDEASATCKPAGKQISGGPKKPTHPFFTGGIARDLDPTKTAANGNAMKTIPVQNPSLRRSNGSLNEMRVNSRPPNPAEASAAKLGDGLPHFASNHTQLIRFPGVREPIWPPAGTVRIEPLFEPFGNLNAKQSSVHGFRIGRKLKDTQIQVPTDEDVLRPLTDLTHRFPAEQDARENIKFQEKRERRRPQRHVMTGRRLQDSISSRLAHSLTSSSVDTRTEVDGASSLPSTRPPAPRCLQRVFEGIATTRSAFDKFECETLDWVRKYAPQSADEVLQQPRDVALLRDWLRSLTISSVGGRNGASSGKVAKHVKRKRTRTEELDGFIVSSDEEANELDGLPASENTNIQPSLLGAKKTVIRIGDTNGPNNGLRASRAVVVSGPHGCGKSAAIYAIAYELGFEVFEINAGSRRSGKDIVERVGDMTRNHLVKQDANTDSKDGKDQVNDIERLDRELQQDLESGRQGTMQSFFKPKGPSRGSLLPKSERKQPGAPKKEPSKKLNRQKQSLILLEEVDVLFEEDKMFWSTVFDLILNSRRPVIMTCTDESLVPLDEINLHGIFRISPCPEQLATDYLLLIACSEGHLLRRDAVEALYRAKRFDLRASLSELNFFCQMAIGDNKGGLEWMLLDTPSNSSEVEGQESLRVVSEDAYCEGLGWVGGELQLFQPQESLQRKADLPSAAQCERAFNSEVESTKLRTSGSQTARENVLQDLRTLDSFFEAYSAGDMFPPHVVQEVNKQQLDPTQPDVRDNLRSHYTEGHYLLQADPIEDQSGTTSALALTLSGCAQRLVKEHARPIWPHSIEHDAEDSITQAGLASSTKEPLFEANIIASFDLIAKASRSVLSIPKGPQISCFDGPASALAEDVAPYIRSIVSYDIRLEEQRRQLSATLTQSGQDVGKTRRTRASRAALEGGSKAYTRRERWFPNHTNLDLVLQTGGQGWQEAALAMMDEKMPLQNEQQVASQQFSAASSTNDDMS